MNSQDILNKFKQKRKWRTMSDTTTKAKATIFRSESKTANQMTEALKKAKSFLSRNESNETVIYEKQKCDKGYRSKLIICIDILCSVVTNGPMTFTKLSHIIELDSKRLIPHLKFLINRGLLKKQTRAENETVYVVTEKGLKILKVVNPIVREAHKIQMRNFEIISSTLSEAGYS